AAGLDDHRLAALVTGDVGLADGRGGAVLGQVPGPLALGVAIAGQEPPVLAPLLDHHPLPALVAADVGLLRARLPRADLLGLVELLPEALVEALQELDALELAGADLVELLLHLGGEAGVHEVEVGPDQAVDDELAEEGGLEAAALELLDVGALLH